MTSFPDIFYTVRKEQVNRFLVTDIPIPNKAEKTVYFSFLSSGGRIEAGDPFKPHETE
jgi:hypothetical protein